MCEDVIDFEPTANGNKQVPLETRGKGHQLDIITILLQ